FVESAQEGGRMRSWYGQHWPLDRRTFLVAGCFACLGTDLAQAAPARRGRAQSTILIWLSGGASHIDTWDMKPNAPLEYRGTFQPVATTVPGMSLCEHLPHLATQAQHLAIVRSLGDFA